MTNFISLNINYLIEKEKLTQNEFGAMFDLGKGVISTYIGGAKPKIETIQRICEHFKISIDDFINRDLSKGKPGEYPISENMLIAAEGGGPEYGM